MPIPNSPLDIKNTTMTGAWVEVKLEQHWTSVIAKMRDPLVGFEVRNPNKPGAWMTINPGDSFPFGSNNFTRQDVLEFKAASSILELAGWTRP